MSDSVMRLGQSTFSQKWCPSPSGRTSGWPHAGHVDGIFHALAPLRRRSFTLPTTSGITSPARRTMTVSPTRTSLASTWISLWRVAFVMVTPETATGSSTANGVALPVRPTFTSIARRIVCCSIGGIL